MTDTRTIIEPGIGCYRSADIDADGLPLELRFHDDASLSPVGAIFGARITHVDTANDMAFADLGGGLTGAMNLRRAKVLVKGAMTISDCVQEGQRLMAQVVAEPSGMDTDKSVSISPRPRLLGRYCVVEAGSPRLNFSKDLPPGTVKTVKSALEGVMPDAAIIVRARAEAAPKAAVQEALWLADQLRQSCEKTGQVFAFSPLEQALLAVPDNADAVEVEGGNALAEAKALAASRWPDLKDRLMAYGGDEPAFDHYGVNETIEEALAPRIDLPSGGWISITPTPALTVVDVNMGNAFKGRSASDAKVLVNLEAALAVMHHLRFQNIGGLIVVDFIDMTQKGAAKELMAVIDEAASQDTVPVQHTGLSTFGLVEFARRRTGLSLKDRLQVMPQPKTRVAGAALDMLRKALLVGKRPQPGALVLSGPEVVTQWLKDHAHYLDDLQNQTQRQIEILLGATPDVFLRGN